MRRTISLALATAMFAGTALSFAPSQAASIAPPAAMAGSDTIIKVGDRHYRHDRNRFHGRRDHRDHRRGGYPFFFGFPFAFAQPYAYYPKRRDCFRAWNGSIICRGYQRYY